VLAWTLFLCCFRDVAAANNEELVEMITAGPKKNFNQTKSMWFLTSEPRAG